LKKSDPGTTLDYPIERKLARCHNEIGGYMAKSFRIRTKEKGNRTLNIELFGDFDASSACELIHVLGKSTDRATKLAIDTDGLRNINVFGLDVFMPRLSDLAASWPDIEITGRFSSTFQKQ
jgi:hypothetical protein